MYAQIVLPFAWTKNDRNYPNHRRESKRKNRASQSNDAGKIAPMAVYLVSDLAKEVTGQIFAVRNNEIFLMSQNRPLRSVHRSDEWTAEKDR